jgi:hypothetical protein
MKRAWTRVASSLLSAFVLRYVMACASALDIAGPRLLGWLGSHGYELLAAFILMHNPLLMHNPPGSVQGTPAHIVIAVTVYAGLLST